MKQPSNEEWRQAIAEANSPRKDLVIVKARQLQANRMRDYNKGLLTPHDLADAIANIWLEALDMIE